ncbi:uncharacterized protein Z518_01782 [Rhinocladiella mackenziei CBS 650.93]|uniref:Zn(2)-C6 fungal-type domain-containing protein n=1 Tax=Rhinocladiella mackenziei CBS 650.93 TaxID=1442369 RepID=A0A0D2HJ52_9EURO|nr:uncharacterized protein Z518_01782 [Rhinocladiella mackenziei CBS 650.93]KIX10698.1 hypothetical protein Z518_01782 [Rhinocladiella mackenziei CBS 650.93]
MERDRRRRRPAFSCLECRRRKIKCDRNEPCAHCVAAKLQCAYKIYNDEPTVRHVLQRKISDDGSGVRQGIQQGNFSGGSTSSPSTAHSPFIQTLPMSTSRSVADYNHQGLWPKIPTAARERHDHQKMFVSGSIPPLDRAQDTEPNLRDMLRRIRNLEESSASNPMHGLIETGRHILESHSGLQDSQIFLNKTRIFRWSHWLGTAPEFATIGDCYTEYTEMMTRGSSSDATQSTGAVIRDVISDATDLETLLSQIGSLLRKCKSIAKMIKVGRPSRSLSRPGFGLGTPSRDVADMMVALYFRFFESSLRILHVPTFWAEYQNYWDHSETVSSDTRLKILLVIAIGSSLSDHTDRDAAFRNMVHLWIYAAQTWLSGPLEKDRLNINGLQIHCLTILARLIFSIGGDMIWMSMGSLIHRAMQIGLHRDPKHLPSMSVLQAELRRRLWATILEMLVQSSLDSAMPPRMSYDEFDTEAPANINDEDMDESTTVLRPYAKSVFTSTSMQLMLLESLPTRLRILQLMNGLHFRLSYLDVLSLSTEINDACRAYNTFVKENEHPGVTPFHRNLLDFFIRRFTILLHCPFASKARQNPLFYYSLKVSLDAAMSILSPEPDDAFAHLTRIGGGGLFREGFRLACTVINLELLAEVDAQRTDGTMHRHSQHRELLKQYVRDAISLSAERIRHGETNVKSHMLLSMVLGQVAATESGKTLLKLEIAKNARDSLIFCHEILQSLPVPVNADLASTTLGDGPGEYGMDLDLDFLFPDAGFS